MTKPKDSRLSSREERPEGEDRAMNDRAITEDREMTDAERLEAFQSQLFNQPLPPLPHIPGWRCIWLTTTNPRDSIQSRMRMGYEPLTPADVPHWTTLSVKTGDYAGMFGLNEMIAFKLPERLWQMYMKESHHDAPNREEEKLSAALDVIRQQAESVRAKVAVEPGSQELGRGPSRPDFRGLDT